jgi:two-component system, OmpR family, sensor kinase
VTIRVRLALIYVGAIVITVGLVGALVWWQLGSALRSSLDQALQTRAAAVLTGLENQGQVGLQEGDSTTPVGVFVAIFDAQGRTIDATAGVPPGLAPPAPDVVSADLSFGGSMYAVHAITGDAGFRVLAGSSLTEIQGTIDRLARSLVIVGGIAAAASLVGGWWLAGRALRPVAMLTAEASQIGATDIERRLPVPPRRDELQALATTLNGMLDRVADALRRQRTFVAAASHDLRTPIAALQAELELAEDGRTTGPELRTAVRAAHADAVRLGELATALLDLAAADTDGRALVRSPVRADLLLESVVRRVEPLAREHRTRLTRTAPGRLVRVDRVRLEQALTNLIVNAIAYGPSEAEVEVVAHFDPDDRLGSRETGTILSIDVLDRGPGVPSEVATRLFEPFHRGPNALGSGNGLGLATAAAAIRAHHGTVGFEPRSGGGTRFWVRLPA